MSDRVARIKDRLQQTLSPQHLELVDASAAHAGHAQAGGAGHFYLTIVSAAFAGKGPVQRHQLVYQALGDMMQSEIHALSIQAYTPEEFATKG
ncbi:BolA family transcriptional regulator, general stress-responsive regulator [Methylomarinovum caldicuralii]|uniref:BolA family transcriptional regulator, general stress-responsive regulator n=1 Tax=Methylomarinovum caldicuralii TaxID=438856 RepID=A0AAU9C227_9GAMM|nr:BolA family protein [Methylomarinovum caldicuralii]BCX81210.1 BolA family transcriptional regulator, general stress-responsive regulator [Methylomarinovum caldicuralii]